MWHPHSCLCVNCTAGPTSSTLPSSNRSVSVRALGPWTVRQYAATPITTAGSVGQVRASGHRILSVCCASHAYIDATFWVKSPLTDNLKAPGSLLFILPVQGFSDFVVLNQRQDIFSFRYHLQPTSEHTSVPPTYK